MNCETVTITGADDMTDMYELVDLSAEFPFVEWGILVSARNEGRQRFPSRHWIELFSGQVRRHGMKVATHICGEWVRELLVGELNWNCLPFGLLPVSWRVQINTHGGVYPSTTAMWDRMDELRGKKFIFQWEGVNDHLARATIQRGGLSALSVLFDKSGGMGLVPDEWPKQLSGIYCGYAGGLGPHNISQQLEKLEHLCQWEYWIDMEQNVRTDDGEKLDLAKVRTVLETVRDWFPKEVCA
jgi:hypothetical protein